MKVKFWIVVATLGKVNSLYLSVETSSGQNRSAVAFRKAWTMARLAMIKLSGSICQLMTRKNAVNVLRILAELALLLDRLKNCFNFYQQPYSEHRICIERGGFRNQPIDKSILPRVGLDEESRFSPFPSQTLLKFPQRFIFNNSISPQSNTVLC